MNQPSWLSLKNITLIFGVKDDDKLIVNVRQ